MTARTEEFWTLANYLTLFRIAAIPLLRACSCSIPQMGRVLPPHLFFSRAVSDVLDGYLARRRNTVSNMGKLLDPLRGQAAGRNLIDPADTPRICQRVDRGRDHRRELAVTTLRGVAGAQG